MNENVDPALDAVLMRRLREVLNGKATAEPANKVISELRQKYNSGKVRKLSSKKLSNKIKHSK